MKKWSIFFTLFFIFSHISAQEKVIILSSKKNTHKRKTITEGQTIGAYLTQSDIEITGMLHIINDHRIQIDTMAINVKDIRIIKVFPTSTLSKKLLQGGLLLISTAGVLTGFVAIFTATHVGLPSALVLFPAGLALDIAGIQGISWSIARLLGTGIYYNLDEWYLEVKTTSSP